MLDMQKHFKIYYRLIILEQIWATEKSFKGTETLKKTYQLVQLQEKKKNSWSTRNVIYQSHNNLCFFFFVSFLNVKVQAHTINRITKKSCALVSPISS